MISAKPTFAPAWPPGWEDVEVVDSVLVADPAPPVGTGSPGLAVAGLYDASGRIAAGGRFGRLVSILA
jgi:hypothetical protein